MRRKSQAMVIMLAGVLGVTGCSGKRERVLQDPGNAKKVIDYTAFKETDLVLETEPVTEKQTEPPTEKITEKITERQTETEEAIRPYDGLYDFSDDVILAAIHTAASGEESGTYTDQTRILVSDDSRLRTIQAGNLIVRLSGKEGAMNETAEVISTDQRLLENLLVNLDISKDADVFRDIMDGKYDSEAAKLIGLADLSRYMDEDGVHLVMKRITHEEDTGTSEGYDATLKSIFPESIAMVDLSQKDAFTDIFSGAGYTKVTESGFEISDMIIDRDKDGAIISTGIGYESFYQSEENDFHVVSGKDESGSFLKIEMTPKTPVTDQEILARFEHIYQMLFHGEFDKTAAINEGLEEGKAYITADSGRTCFAMTIRQTD